MAKREEPAVAGPAALPAPSEPDSFELSLTEFCTRRSITDRRAELLGGFYADETRQGHAKATEAEWTARLEAFATRPAL